MRPDRRLEEAPARGEVVILIGGAERAKPSEQTLRDAAAQLRAEGRSARDIAAVLSSEYGAPRNLAYRLAHDE